MAFCSRAYYNDVLDIKHAIFVILELGHNHKWRQNCNWILVIKSILALDNIWEAPQWHSYIVIFFNSAGLIFFNGDYRSSFCVLVILRNIILEHIWNYYSQLYIHPVTQNVYWTYIEYHTIYKLKNLRITNKGLERTLSG